MIWIRGNLPVSSAAIWSLRPTRVTQFVIPCYPDTSSCPSGEYTTVSANGNKLWKCYSCDPVAAFPHTLSDRRKDRTRDASFCPLGANKVAIEVTKGVRELVQHFSPRTLRSHIHTHPSTVTSPTRAPLYQARTPAMGLGLSSRRRNVWISELDATFRMLCFVPPLPAPAGAGFCALGQGAIGCSGVVTIVAFDA